VGTVRPLGTAARVAAALTLDPTMSATDANIVALATELVTLRREYAGLTGKVEKLEQAVTVLLKLSTAPAAPAPVPVPQAAPVEPVEPVEPPAATQRRMNPAQENRVRRMNGLAPLPQPDALPYLSNARLIRVFDSFIEAGIHFNKEAHDANLAKPSARYLLDAANAYLDAYQGGDTYLLSVQRCERDRRSVPQLRGVLGKMLTFYKSARTRA